MLFSLVSGHFLFVCDWASLVAQALHNCTLLTGTLNHKKALFELDIHM